MTDSNKPKDMKSLYKSEHGKGAGYKPTRAPEAEPYWQGCREGRLVLPWCRDCGKPHFYPRPFCPHCEGRRLDWRPASGRATLYAHATVHQPLERPFKERVPYTIGIVELEEGVRMLTQVVGVAPDRVRTDMALQVTFDPLIGEVPVPIFKPA